MLATRWSAPGPSFSSRDPWVKSRDQRSGSDPLGESLRPEGSETETRGVVHAR